jgi:hypothetical protein
LLQRKKEIERETDEREGRVGERERQARGRGM